MPNKETSKTMETKMRKVKIRNITYVLTSIVAVSIIAIVFLLRRKCGGSPNGRQLLCLTDKMKEQPKEEGIVKYHCRI
jgi:formate/nitrite transporter FocA (FNT family)